MSKQDSNGVRTAQDLERKYDFASLLGLKKNVEISEGSAGVKGKRIFRYSHKRQKKMKELFDIQTELKEKRRELSRYALED